MIPNHTAGSLAVATGLALAITVGIGYTLCALLFRAAPDAAMTFMNVLFHGLDFRKLQAVPASFEFGSFFLALTVLVVWAFLLGALFGWIIDRFRGRAR